MKRSPLKKCSKKRSDALIVYRKLRKIYLESNPVCEICHEANSTEIHHKMGRGANLNRIDEFLSVCRNCHKTKVHDQPNEARKQGWLK